MKEHPLRIQPVMSEYHKMYTNEFPNIFGCHIIHYVPSEYPNLFKCNIFPEQISKSIHTPEIAQIRIQLIFDGHFTGIFKSLY